MNRVSKLTTSLLAVIVIICSSCKSGAESPATVTTHALSTEDSTVTSEAIMEIVDSSTSDEANVIENSNLKSPKAISDPQSKVEKSYSIESQKSEKTTTTDKPMVVDDKPKKVKNEATPQTTEVLDTQATRDDAIALEQNQMKDNKVSPNQTPPSKPSVIQDDNAYVQPLDELLKTYVSTSGIVDYTGLKNNSSKLDAIIKLLQSNAPKASWSKSTHLAYWINAYNVFTLKLIVDNYPVKSIMDLHNGKPWDVKWINIGGKTYSLNQIEHEIIRPTFKDARIHFAVNCAAKSCPPLSNEAYKPKSLDSQLDKNTKSFINNTAYNNLAEGKVSISKIFEWYRDDFGNLTSYLNKYSKVQINPAAKLSFTEYDWSLNGK